MRNALGTNIKGMAHLKNLHFDEEDEETLAAIDEGIRDCEAGRTVPIEDVRRLLPTWITDSSSRKGR